MVVLVVPWTVIVRTFVMARPMHNELSPRTFEIYFLTKVLFCEHGKEKKTNMKNKINKVTRYIVHSIYS